VLVAIDRASRFAVVELVERAGMRAAAAFLESLIEAVPYRIHSVLTDNGIQFADLPKNRQGQPHTSAAIPSTGSVSFMAQSSQTNGESERMNRTIKDATVKRYFYDP